MPLVRIKPHNPKKGRVKRSYTDLRLGMRFRVERGWYEVDESAARRLSKARMRDGDIDSPRVFDIAEDKEEALEIEEHYRAAAAKGKKEEANPGSADEPLRTHRPGRRSAPKAEAKRETEPAPSGDDDGGETEGDLTTGDLGETEGDEDENTGDGDGGDDGGETELTGAESTAETKPRGRRKKAATARQKGKS